MRLLGCSKQVMQVSQVQRWEQEEEAERRSWVAGVKVAGIVLAKVEGELWAWQYQHPKHVSYIEDLI